MEIQEINRDMNSINTSAKTTGVSDVGSSQKVEPITIDYDKQEEKGDSSSPKERNEQAVLGSEQLDPEKVKRAVASMNQKIRQTHTSCQFSYHEETHRISIKVIDDDSKKVIREIPPEKTLDMVAKSLELAGILVDEKR